MCKKIIILLIILLYHYHFEISYLESEYIKIIISLSI